MGRRRLQRADPPGQVVQGGLKRIYLLLDLLKGYLQGVELVRVAGALDGGLEGSELLGRVICLQRGQAALHRCGGALQGGDPRLG